MTRRANEAAPSRPAAVRVSVLVVNWNGWRNTAECLESLARQDYPAYEIVVVDNGSTDGSGDRIAAWARGEITVDSAYVPARAAPQAVPFARVRIDLAAGSPAPHHRAVAVPPFRRGVLLLEVGQNLGFTGGNNVGIRYALDRGAEFLFLLNNDAVARRDALTETVAVALQDPRVGMVAPMVLEYADPSRIDRQGIVLTRGGLAYERKGARDGPLLCPDGCAALYSRALLEGVVCRGEYFDEALFAYGEDVDLGIRAVRRGFRATSAEGAIIYHKGGASLGGMDSAESLYLRHRNTLWIILKDFPTNTLLRNAAWIALGQLGTLARGLTGAGRGSVLRGKIDGIKGARAAWAKRSSLGDEVNDLPMVARVFLPGRRRPQALYRSSGALQSGRGF